MINRNPTALTKYGFAFGVIALATCLRLVLNPYLGHGVPFLLFFPAIVLIAWFGGKYPGIVSTAVTALISWYALIPPHYSFKFLDFGGRTQVIVFLFAGTLISMLAESLHAARKKTEGSEKKEREQRERFAITLASIRDAVIATDSEGRITFMNSVAENLTQRPLQDASGSLVEQVFCIVSEQDGQPITNLVSRAMSEGGADPEEHIVLIRKGGSTIPIEYTGAPIKDADGFSSGAVFTFRDISERRHAEDRFRLAVESAPNAVVMINDSGKIVLVNAQTERLFGYNRQEMIEQPIEMLVPERYRRRHPGYRTAFSANPETRPMGMGRDLYGLKKDGTEVPIEIGLNPIIVAGKIMVLSSIVDITARKQAEEERAGLLQREKAARSEAESASLAKDTFLAAVSHELRTPLNAILGWAQMLRSAALDPLTVTSAIDTIYTSARNQAQIIEDLLDVSRITSGKMRLLPQRMLISNVLSAAMNTVRPAINAKSIQVDVLYQSDTRSIFLHADPQRLQQVFWNLLSNAVKFTPPGGKIDVFVDQMDSEISLAFKDTGMGISKEYLPFLFNPFYQADSGSTRKYGGLGLGLSITKHLVELHGGNVIAQSEGEGMGATFIVRLPLYQPGKDVAAETQRSASPDGFAYRTELQGIRILLVDDDTNTLRMLQQAFLTGGALVQTGKSAEEGLQIVQDWEPDILVSDIAMPEKDGLWLIRQVRALAQPVNQTPAIALTAYASETDRANILSSGFQIFVPKPAEPAELLSIAMALLEQQSRNTEGLCERRSIQPRQCHPRYWREKKSCLLKMICFLPN